MGRDFTCKFVNKAKIVTYVNYRMIFEMMYDFYIPKKKKRFATKCGKMKLPGLSFQIAVFKTNKPNLRFGCVDLLASFSSFCLLHVQAILDFFFDYLLAIFRFYSFALIFLFETSLGKSGILTGSFLFHFVFMFLLSS